MDASTTTTTSDEDNLSFAGSCEEVTPLIAPDIAPDRTTTPQENADNNPDYLQPRELVPVFTAMALAIFILGLASDLGHSL